MSRVKLDQPKVNGSLGENSSKIDAIKELLFGEEINGYDSEFQALKKDILQKRKELEKLISEVKSDLLASIDNVSVDIDKRMAELEKTVSKRTDALEDKKVDKKALGNLLVKLGEKIGQ